MTSHNKEKAAPAGTAYKNNLERQSYLNPRLNQGNFDHSALPAPAIVLRKLGIMPPDRVNAAGYWVLRCPFHKDGQEQHASLNMHANKGYFRCHACGVHGGDVLAFYMAMNDKCFADAARDLGAWRAGL